MSAKESVRKAKPKTLTYSEVLETSVNKWTAMNTPVHTGGLLNDLSWAIGVGDAQKNLQAIPDKSVDCVITSPPYFWLRDYDNDAQYGLEDSLDLYIDNLVGTFNQCHRVLKSEGVAFLNLGDTYYSGKGESQGHDPKSKKRRFGLRAVDKSGGLGIGLKPKSAIGVPWRVAIKLMENGWALRSTIIWDRQHSLPESVKDRPRRNFEYIFMLTKSRKYYFSREALTKSEEEDIWTISARPEGNNGLSTAPFPDAVVERCLSIGCPPSGIVLDPFLGSGTTARVSISSGRYALGIELNREFAIYAANRLQRE